MGLLDTVTGVLGGLGNVAPGVAERPVGNRSSVRVVSGDAAYDTIAEVLALITGAAHADFFKIWQRTVPAQQLVAWGYGSPALQQNQGYMWFASLDIAADWDVGVLRITQASHNERIVKVVAELPDAALHTQTVTTLATATPTNKNEMIPLPEKVEFPLIGEDSLLQLWYALITAATAHDQCGFEIPITEYTR